MACCDAWFEFAWCRARVKWFVHWLSVHRLVQKYQQFMIVGFCWFFWCMIVGPSRGAEIPTLSMNGSDSSLMLFTQQTTEIGLNTPIQTGQPWAFPLVIQASVENWDCARQKRKGMFTSSFFFVIPIAEYITQLSNKWEKQCLMFKQLWTTVLTNHHATIDRDPNLLSWQCRCNSDSTQGNPCGMLHLVRFARAHAAATPWQ